MAPPVTIADDEVRLAVEILDASLVATERDRLPQSSSITP
jgi:hypothetical protein